MVAFETVSLLGNSAVKGGEKVDHCGREKVYHRGVDEKKLVRLPVGVDLEQFWNELGVFQFFRDLKNNALPATLEAVAVPFLLQDAHMVSEAVYRPSAVGSESTWPFPSRTLVLARRSPQWVLMCSALAAAG